MLTSAGFCSPNTRFGEAVLPFAAKPKSMLYLCFPASIGCVHPPRDCSHCRQMSG